jgi:hypothetical protein
VAVLRVGRLEFRWLAELRCSISGERSKDNKMLESAYRANLPVTKDRKRSSQVFEELLQQAPAKDFTIGWLLSKLHRRSFGVVVLFLGLLASTPVGSSVPGLILVVMAVQMIGGRREPAFPRLITARSLPTDYLRRIGSRAVPVLQYFEKVVHPRWPTLFEGGKRFVGFAVLSLTAVLLLTPVPLSNVVPAVLIALIALAYIEEDGMLLCLAYLAAVILIGVEVMAVWGAVFSVQCRPHRQRLMALLKE